MIGLRRIILISLLACACDGETDPGSNTGMDAGAADARAAEPKLAATCDVNNAGSCPAGMKCLLELGCVIEPCPRAGPGGNHGCPGNGFCYTVDQSMTGYCALVCTSTTDCTRVNKALACRERTSAEPWSLKLCVPPNG